MVFTLRLVIPERSSSVLLVEDGSGWALPRVMSDEAEMLIDVAPTVREVTGLDVIVLRELRVGPVPPPDDKIIYLTERVRDPSVARGRWSREEDVSRLDFADAHDRTAVQAWFDEERTGASSSGQPWQREGWYSTAVAWIEETMPHVTRVAQFATWCNSCILRVETADGRYYFKASPDYFAQEPVVTAMLGERFPRKTPRTVAVEPERRWMVLADLGDVAVSTLSLDDRAKALDAIAELHRESVDHVGELLESGCRDRRASVLSGQIATLAADDTVPLPGDLRQRLHAAVPRLVEACAELEMSSIPPTLVHGDLHADNIMFTEGRYVIFDWTDACVADPFVDVLMFLSRLPETPSVRRAFRDRYLAAWKEVVSGSEADELYELAEPLAAMHHAVTYRGIYDAFGEAEWWRFSGALPGWIEKALACPIVGG